MARLLSATPGLKRLVKRAYVALNAAIYRKPYKYKILSPDVDGISLPGGNIEGETFFGYYDKSPENSRGEVIMHLTARPTSQKPSADTSVTVCVVSPSGQVRKIASTATYNWQQGARAHWLDDDTIIYNTLEEGTYRSRVYDLRSGSDRPFGLAVEQTHGADKVLSLNFARIMALRPDYGYRNLPLPSQQDLLRGDNDGIFDTRSGQLILSLDEICACRPQPDFEGALHKANHLMYSPDGSKYIFIHRYYRGGRRTDRLMLAGPDGSLKVLANNRMVSHLAWVDNDTLLGYLRHDNRDGFWFINLRDGSFTLCEPMTALATGDGHPSVHGNLVVFDSYPDKSRMQHLYLYNLTTNEVTPLLELHQPVKYQGECRCDLHPRFSPNGNRIYFDTVFSGKRRLAFIDITKLV